MGTRRGCDFSSRFGVRCKIPVSEGSILTKVSGFQHWGHCLGPLLSPNFVDKDK